MTPGSAGINADGTSEAQLKAIQQSLRSGTFQWNPVKRINTPKPVKPVVTRPLGLPDFTDKLVENCILIVLNSIYEPEFDFVKSNYGFRPKNSPNSVIKRIRIENEGSDVAIEGDIQGAYDYVDHGILMKILRKRISDFLDLIYSALRCGYMQDSPFCFLKDLI